MWGSETRWLRPKTITHSKRFTLTPYFKKKKCVLQTGNKDFAHSLNTQYIYTLTIQNLAIIKVINHAIQVNKINYKKY